MSTNHVPTGEALWWHNQRILPPEGAVVTICGMTEFECASALYAARYPARHTNDPSLPVDCEICALRALELGLNVGE